MLKQFFKVNLYKVLKEELPNNVDMPKLQDCYYYFNARANYEILSFSFSSPDGSKYTFCASNKGYCVTVSMNYFNLNALPSRVSCVKQLPCNRSISLADAFYETVAYALKGGVFGEEPLEIIERTYLRKENQ